MKFAVSVTMPRFEANLDLHFGRAPAFVFVDTATGEHDAVANPASNQRGGAGIRAAEFLVGEGVEAVISGAFGPKAYEVLHAADVRLYRAQSGTADELVSKVMQGELVVWEDA